MQVTYIAQMESDKRMLCHCGVHCFFYCMLRLFTVGRMSLLWAQMAFSLDVCVSGVFSIAKARGLL